MADETVLNTAEIDALFDKIASLASRGGYGKMLLFIGGRIGTQIEGLERVIPPAPNRPRPMAYTLNGKPSKWKTTKQQGFFFWALRRGKLKIPYRRTGFLVGSLTHIVTLMGDGVEIRVGTNAKYAPLVIGGDGEQAQYHNETGWLQLPKQPSEHLGEIRENIVESAKTYIFGYLGLSL